MVTPSDKEGRDVKPAIVDGKQSKADANESPKKQGNKRMSSTASRPKRAASNRRKLTSSPKKQTAVAPAESKPSEITAASATAENTTANTNKENNDVNEPSAVSDSVKAAPAATAVAAD